MTEGDELHDVVVVGAGTDDVVLHDPTWGPARRVALDRLLPAWKAAGFWALLVLPARRRQRAHQAMQDGIVEGDEIITAGGLHAVVVEAGDQEIRVEIAPGVVARLDRRAVAAVARDAGPGED